VVCRPSRARTQAMSTVWRHLDDDRQSWARIAAECGYAAQAHLIREFRRSPAPPRARSSPPDPQVKSVQDRSGPLPAPWCHGADATDQSVRLRADDRSRGPRRRRSYLVDLVVARHQRGHGALPAMPLRTLARAGRTRSRAGCSVRLDSRPGTTNEPEVTLLTEPDQANDGAAVVAFDQAGAGGGQGPVRR
jgi:hypothetical protein